MNLREAVINELGGVGACSPYIYAKKIEHIAEITGRKVDDKLHEDVRQILKTLPCPLD
jgi:hypothetical protein